MQRPRSRLADSAVLSDGSFTLALPLLQTFARGALADGATDKAGNISRHDLCFILDTTARPSVMAYTPRVSRYWANTWHRASPWQVTATVGH
jgi:hypothetical protein